MSVVLLLLRLELHGACVLALLQHLLVGFEHGYCHLGVLVVANGCYLRLLLQLALYGFEVLELQLGVDYFLVFYGIDAGTALAHDVVVVEAAQNVYDGVGLADVAEELVAQTFALACALDESGYVYYLARCGHDTARMYYLGELCESLVGYCYHAYVRLDCTEGEVGCLRLGVG